MKKYTMSIFLSLLIKVLQRFSLILNKIYDKRKKKKNRITFLSFLSQHTNYGSSRLSTSWTRLDHSSLPTQMFITLPITLRRFKMEFTSWTSQGLWKFLDDSIASFLYWKYVSKLIRIKTKKEKKTLICI